MSTFSERKGRSDKGCGAVSPYKKYLLEQWNGGCHDTKKLFSEIQVLGYEGSYCTVARYTSRQHAAQGFKHRYLIPFRSPSPLLDHRKADN